MLRNRARRIRPIGPISPRIFVGPSNWAPNFEKRGKIRGLTPHGSPMVDWLAGVIGPEVLAISATLYAQVGNLLYDYANLRHGSACVLEARGDAVDAFEDA